SAADDRTSRRTRNFIGGDAEIGRHWNGAEVDRLNLFEQYGHGFYDSMNFMLLNSFPQTDGAKSGGADNVPAADDIPQSAGDLFEHLGKKAGGVALSFANIGPKDAAVDAAPLLIALSLEHLANRQAQRADKNAMALAMRRPE